MNIFGDFFYVLNKGSVSPFTTSAKAPAAEKASRDENTPLP